MSTAKLDCCDCNETFPESETASRQEAFTDEFWGARQTIRQTVLLCPYCGSDNIATSNEVQDNE